MNELEKQKLTELTAIFEHGVSSGDLDSLGIINFKRQFNVDILKRVKNENYTIEFENISQLINVFSYKMNTEMIEKLTNDLKEKAKIKGINIDRKFTIQIKFQ